jgi:hypothetical protein
MENGPNAIAASRDANAENARARELASGADRALDEPVPAAR